MNDQKNNIAKVVVNISLDREFDYRIPESLHGKVHIGSRVRIPFGKGRGERVGYVVNLADESSVQNLKEIAGLEETKPTLPGVLVRLAEWLAEYYCCTKEQAVRTMLPAVVRSGRESEKRQMHVRINGDKNFAEILPDLEKRAPKQAAVLQELIRLESAVPLQRLLSSLNTSRNVVDRLAENNHVVVEQKAVQRDPFAEDEVLPSSHLELTDEQASTLQNITEGIQSETSKVVLLYGITGSGKTEVYLQAISECLEQGKEAIVLVPEISLTPQTTERFRSRFGDGLVSVLHSRLSEGERYDEWRKIHEGRSQIVVGARSALFAPFENVGLIVVDEEHETTYKQEEAPRYNARDVAVVRGRMEKAAVVLGSATPSLESYYNCYLEKYSLAELSRRIDGRLLPTMEAVDMRQEAATHGGAQIFSTRLTSLIRDRLEQGDQVLLFLNRRGYATQMLCEQCGFVAQCQDCDVAFTYHRTHNQLICHLCGYVKPAPEKCPDCGNKEIRYSGLGTEKIEALARKLFPYARIARMDADTTTGKHSHKKTLDDFRASRIDILIGTQMIAKGLHFPNVTLVGVMFADLGLHVPDFRAGERTFQLLTQVAGRAGRGDVHGHVIVQSYTPFHPALQAALAHDYEGFAEDELEGREALHFPPATHAAMLHFKGDTAIRTAEFAETFAKHLRPALPDSVEVGTPAPAPINKIKNKYRYQMLIKGHRIRKISQILRYMVMNTKTPKDIHMYVDIDPYSLL